MSFSQSELAKQSGVSQSAISSIEIGENQPTVKTIETLCNTIGISLLEFFAESSISEDPLHVFELLNINIEPSTEQIKQDFKNATKELSPKQMQLITQLIKNLKG